MVPPSPATLMRVPGVPPPPVAAAPVIRARAVSVVERTVPARYSPLLILAIIAIIALLLLLKLRLLEMLLLLELLLHHRLLLHLHVLLHEPVKHLILVSAHKLRIHQARHEVRCKRGNLG